MDREGLIAGCREAIDAEEGEMDLAIGCDDAGRADQGAGIEEMVARNFEQADDRPNAKLCAIVGKRLGAAAGNRFAVQLGFVQALVAIAGQGALRENDELRTVASGFAQTGADRLQVLRLVGKRAIHLHGGNLPAWHDRSSTGL